MKLRPYQKNLLDKLLASKSDDLVQLDTGAGKTPIIAALAAQCGKAIVVCHRNILLRQASEKLAAFGLGHRIVSTAQTRRICAINNAERHGRHYIDRHSDIVLMSVDSWNSRRKRGQLYQHLKNSLLIIDEAHHVVADNKWGSLHRFVGGRCVGLTATPVRSDGQPLTKTYGGTFDRIIQADGYDENGTERLISEGYLSAYRAFYAGYATPDNRGVLSVAEYAADCYQKRTPGKKAIVIFPRISNAKQGVEHFKKHGIAAAVIHSGLPQYEVERVLQAFADNKIKVLVAVDMLSEGYDIPDADVLILARKITSFGLYRQLCGRVLRPRKGKLAQIFDLNGLTIAAFGLPSDAVDWNQIQTANHERYLLLCPACGCFFRPTSSFTCPECGEPYDIKRAVRSGKNIEIHETLAEMLEKHRNKINYEESRRLYREKIEAERLRWEQTYIERDDIKFDNSMIGKKCAELFAIVDAELKKMLPPAEYNEFMKDNSKDMLLLGFYADYFVGNTDSNTDRVKKIYEKYQHDKAHKRRFVRI